MSIKFEYAKLARCIENQSDPEPFSGVVYVTRGSDVLFEHAHGFAIVSESIPNTINTRFQMASGCKVFTAVGILRLIEQGRLSLSTPLLDCVDIKMPQYSKEITIGNLLTHCSGITSYFEEDVNPDYAALWKDIPMYNIRGPRDVLPMFINKPMKFAPGEKFEYNDGGFILLGVIIESITGAAFPDYITKNVLKPAGMTDSGYFATDMLPGRTAYSYIKNPDGTVRTNFFAVPIVGLPDGGAFTTAPDMMRFWKALLGHKLLSAETVNAMIQPQITTGWKVPFSHYGHGVWIEKPGDKIRKIFVEGYDPGVALRSSVYPEHDLILTMIGNTSEALWPVYKAIEAELGL